jgi:transposase
MYNKQEIIRRYFRENDGERKIARDMQVSRKTVKKILQEYMQAERESQDKNDPEKLQDYSQSPPRYNIDNRERRRLTPEMASIIREQISDNARKKREGLRKQIKRNIDIYELLQSKGFQIGYTTVCNYIREDKLVTQEAYIKQVHLPGEECEFDWAEVKLQIGEAKKRLYMAVFTSSYGNYRYSGLYTRQDTLAFMESHNDFFEHVGGVYHEMVYDNMRVAVADFVGRHEKTPTDALVGLSGWYQFRWRFCNVRRGNEKGHVERSVEYIRRKAFSHIDKFDTIEQARAHLVAVCQKLNSYPLTTTGKSPLASLAEEKDKLWKYPGVMSCYLTNVLKVDKYSTICFNTNRYSVPDHHTGSMVEVKIYSNKLKVYYNNDLICQHERIYATHEWKINIDHYLRTLSLKPGALHGSLALLQAPELLRELYFKHFVNQPRGFIDILHYCHSKEVTIQKVMETVSELTRLCPGDISCEKIIAILGNQTPLTMITNATINGEIELFSHRQLEEIASMVNNINN